MSQDTFHERTSKHRFYVADVYPNGNIVVEIPGGKTTLDRDAIKFAAVGDVGTCYILPTSGMTEHLVYEPDLKAWGREARAITNAVASARRRCDECIQISDWQGLQMAALSLMNAAAMLHSHFEKQP